MPTIVGDARPGGASTAAPPHDTELLESSTMELETRNTAAATAKRKPTDVHSSMLSNRTLLISQSFHRILWARGSFHRMLNPLRLEVGPTLVSLLALSRPAIRMAAPEIDWQDGVVVSNEAVAESKATRQLSIRATTPLEYKPGHILGLGFSHDGVDLKGPYTVTRSSDSQLDVVYRIIPDGRKTPLMASMEAGAAVRFGGKFGTPIEDGIALGVDRVVWHHSLGTPSARSATQMARASSCLAALPASPMFAAPKSSTRSQKLTRENSPGPHASPSRWRARRSTS